MRPVFRPLALCTAVVVILAVAACCCRDRTATPLKPPTPVARALRPDSAPGPLSPPPIQSAAPDSGELGRPGEAAAKQAALIGAEDWIAEVQTHSPGWNTATVAIGLPQTAPLLAISLRWDAGAGYYDVVAEQELPYP